MFAAAVFDVLTFLAAIISFRSLRKAIEKGTISLPEEREGGSSQSLNCG